jgi:hypothetical protein
LSDAQVKTVIEAARFDATDANKRDAAESAYDNYLEARLDALERNKQRTLEDYHKCSLLDPLPASASDLWSAMRNALKNND